MMLRKKSETFSFDQNIERDVCVVRCERASLKVFFLSSNENCRKIKIGNVEQRNTQNVFVVSAK